MNSAKKGEKVGKKLQNETKTIEIEKERKNVINDVKESIGGRNGSNKEGEDGEERKGRRR